MIFPFILWRERERQTDRQADRQTDRQTDRDRVAALQHRKIDEKEVVEHLPNLGYEFDLKNN